MAARIQVGEIVGSVSVIDHPAHKFMERLAFHDGVGSLAWSQACHLDIGGSSAHGSTPFIVNSVDRMQGIELRFKCPEESGDVADGFKGEALFAVANVDVEAAGCVDLGKVGVGY